MTRHRRIAAWLAGLVLSLPGCDSPTSTAPGPTRIDFSHLEVGQRSVYAGFVGQDYGTRENTDVTYTGDLLVVEVVAETDTGFVFRETVTSGPDSGGVLQAGEVFEWVGRMVDDTFERVPLDTPFIMSRLLPNAPDAFNMGMIEGVEAEIIGWVTSVPYCECYVEGHVLGYRQFGRHYNRLNLVVDDVDMQRDGPGQTYLYSREYGFVRASETSWWTQQGSGWDLR